MKHLLLVGFGGALGSVLRYSIGVFSRQLFLASDLPWGTIIVNLVGCFLIGCLAEFAALNGSMKEETRLLLISGFLGGFTTFSAFSLESVELIERGMFSFAVINILLSVLGGVTAVYAGIIVLRLILKA